MMAPALPIAAAVLALGAQPSGQYRAELSGRDVSLAYTVSPTDLTVAQRVRVELGVTAPAGWSIAWPAVGEKLGRASVVSTTDARDGLTHTRTIILEPYLPGDDTIPSLSVSVSPRDPQAAAAPVTLSTEPVTLRIRALEPEEGAGSLELPQLRGEREPAKDSAGAPIGALIGGGAAVLAAGVAGVLILTRRTPAPTDEAGAALATIDAIAAAPAPTSDAARHAALDTLGAAARRYLRARGVAGAEGAATPDLGPMLARVPQVAPVADGLTALLATIDAARFDPRRSADAPGPIAGRLAALLRTHVAEPGERAGGGAP